jgi:hypothetical protein
LDAGPQPRVAAAHRIEANRFHGGLIVPLLGDVRKAFEAHPFSQFLLIRPGEFFDDPWQFEIELAQLDQPASARGEWQAGKRAIAHSSPKKVGHPEPVGDEDEIGGNDALIREHALHLAVLRENLRDAKAGPDRRPGLADGSTIGQRIPISHFDGESGLCSGFVA